MTRQKNQRFEYLALCKIFSINGATSFQFGSALQFALSCRRKERLQGRDITGDEMIALVSRQIHSRDVKRAFFKNLSRFGDLHTLDVDDGLNTFGLAYDTVSKGASFVDADTDGFMCDDYSVDFEGFSEVRFDPITGEEDFDWS